MAYVEDNTLITTAARTAYAADKTLMLASVAQNQNQDPRWTTGGAWTDPDVTASSFYAYRAVDGLIDVPTKPALSGTSALFLLFDLANVDIGALAIIGHNFAKMTGSVTVSVEIADTSDYSVGPGRRLQIASWPIADARRLVSLSLNTNKVYTGVRYVRIKISSSVPIVVAPEIGELVLGTPRIMGHRPDRPWDSRAEEGDLGRFRSKAGGSVRYLRNAGGVVLRPTWTPELGVDDRGLDDSETLRTIYRDCGRGKRCILFVDQPSTNPRRAHWVELDRAASSIPEVDYKQGTAAMVLTEQTPFALPEEFP